MSRTTYNKAGFSLNNFELIGTLVSLHQQVNHLGVKIVTTESYQKSNSDEWVNNDEFHYVKVFFSDLQNKINGFNEGDVIRLEGRIQPWSQKQEDESYKNGVDFKVTAAQRVMMKA